MPIKKFWATKDTTIKNAFKSNLTTRMTGSNMGSADVLETFAIYSQATTSSTEASRILIEFPINEISIDRTNGDIPMSGNVEFHLKLSNAEHPFTLPSNFTLAIAPISRSWQEGQGLDMDNGNDLGFANWLTASSGSTSGYDPWTTAGGDIHTKSYTPGSTLPNYTYDMKSGDEDLDLNITSLVEEWIADSNGTATNNYGIRVSLTESIENALSSSYTKQFFARSSEFFFKRPYLEARWQPRLDDRGNFYSSSSLADATDNTNVIYLYNYLRGRLKNIPNLTNNVIYVQYWNDPVSGNIVQAPPVTGGLSVDTGIYTASTSIQTTASFIYDKWFSANLATCYHTGSVKVNSQLASNINPNNEYVVKITNLKSEYNRKENARFRVFARSTNWNPNIYSVAQKDLDTETLDRLYYRVVRVVDEYEAIPYLTGSMSGTMLSRDVSGSYFDLKMNLLEGDYMYYIQFLQRINENPESYKEFSNKYKFRIQR